jgi:hypothetical protein
MVRGSRVGVRQRLCEAPQIAASSIELMAHGRRVPGMEPSVELPGRKAAWERSAAHPATPPSTQRAARRSICVSSERRCGQDDRSCTHDRWPRKRAHCGRAVPRPHVVVSVCARHRRRSRHREDDHLAGGSPSSSGARILGPAGTSCPERSKAVVRRPRRPDRHRFRGNEDGASTCSATGPCGGAAAWGR